ncbi:MAG: hypothetical protein ACRDQ1_16675 [Sciscionella sp.]
MSVPSSMSSGLPQRRSKRSSVLQWPGITEEEIDETIRLLGTEVLRAPAGR